jgi:hypothetical protein
VLAVGAATQVVHLPDSVTVSMVSDILSPRRVASAAPAPQRVGALPGAAGQPIVVASRATGS